MNADKIEEIVNELLELKKTKTREEINELEKFSDFKSKNKVFYEVILSSDMDISIFREMMRMKRRLEAGEDQYSVDVKFGEFMAGKYIDPVIKKK
jgi:hypothetical protein